MRPVHGSPATQASAVSFSSAALQATPAASSPHESVLRSARDQGHMPGLAQPTESARPQSRKRPRYAHGSSARSRSAGTEVQSSVAPRIPNLSSVASVATLRVQRGDTSAGSKPAAHTEPLELAALLASFLPLPRLAVDVPSQMAAEPSEEPSWVVPDDTDWDPEVLELLANPLDNEDRAVTESTAAQAQPRPDPEGLYGTMLSFKLETRRAVARESLRACPQGVAVLNAIGNAENWIETQLRAPGDLTDITNVRELERKCKLFREVVSEALDATFNPQRIELIESFLRDSVRELNLRPAFVAGEAASFAAQRLPKDHGAGPVTDVAVAAAGSIALHLLRYAARLGGDSNAARMQVMSALNETESGRLVLSRLSDAARHATFRPKAN